MNTTREYHVAIGAELKPVGTIRFGRARGKQASQFRYLPEWLQDPEALALAPSLPLHEHWTHCASHVDDRGACLPGVIADCAPDSWGRTILMRDAGHELDEMDYLLGSPDATRHGALRFLDGNGTPLGEGDPPDIANLTTLRSLTSEFHTGSDRQRALASALRGANTSLGGARPKSTVMDAAGDLYIAKYTMPEDTMPIERAEVATLLLAGDVGIRAASAKLVERDSKYPIAVIKRFDRHGMERIHYMSAQTLLERRRGEQGYYSDIGESLRQVCASGEHALGELKELYRRSLFNILVSNTDDHLQNHGLLFTRGEWGLSPAFDLNPRPERHRQLKTGISELSGFEASAEAWLDAAPFFELTVDAARGIAIDMAQRIRAQWRVRLREQGMNRGGCDMYQAAFDHAESRFALGLDKVFVTARAAQHTSASEDGGHEL